VCGITSPLYLELSVCGITFPLYLELSVCGITSPLYLELSDVTRKLAERGGGELCTFPSSKEAPKATKDYKISSYKIA
jgi:hypothetical protein